MCPISVMVLLMSGMPVLAPVPRPVVLTEDLVVGTWSYEWSQWPDGTIAFNANGTFSAVHWPNASVFWAGTWKIEGTDTVTITEHRYCAATGNRLSETPGTYAFKFKTEGYPTLSGLSNGTTKVVLSGRRQ